MDNPKDTPKRLLDAAAESAIQKAQAHKEAIKDAVNWGDLHCVETEVAYTRGGEVVYRAYIEEASPHSTDLITFVLNELRENGFGGINIEVITEW